VQRTFIEVAGKRVLSGYKWMRTRVQDDAGEEVYTPEFENYLKAENEYADRALAPLADLKRQVLLEFRTRLPKEDIPYVARQGSIVHFERTRDDWDYSQFCMRPADGSGPEIVILDENEMAKGHIYYDLNTYAISPDESLVGYSVDYTGGRHSVLHVKDIKTAAILPDKLEHVDAFEWTLGSDAICYTKMNRANRASSLWLHQLGADPKGDVMLFKENDAAFSLEMNLSRDELFIVLESDSPTRSECYVLDRANPDALHLVFSRSHRAETNIDLCNGRIFALTNEGGAFNFKVLWSKYTFGEAPQFETLLEADPNINRESIFAFNQHLVVVARVNGKRILEVVDLESKATSWINFPEASYSLEVVSDENTEADSETIIAHFGSYIIPHTVLEINFKTGHVGQSPVLQPVEPRRSPLYESRVEWFPARDGTNVPVSLFYRKDLLKEHEPNPMVLEGYGCYGDPYEPDPERATYRMSMMDRGVIVGIAHVRGGGELGTPWHKAAVRENRIVSAHDFIDCAEALIQSGLTSSDKLGAYGRSAGGFLMGVVANLRPDLFKVIFTQVPFVDVLNTMSDPEAPLSAGEMEYYGDPKDPADLQRMRSYCPLHNVKKGKPYPNIYCHTGRHDPWVSVHEPAEWIAKLHRSYNGPNQIVLREYHEGHSGHSAKSKLLEEWAEGVAFTLWHLGIRS